MKRILQFIELKIFKPIESICLILLVILMLIKFYQSCFGADITINHIRANQTDKTVYFTITGVTAISCARYHADIPLAADPQSYLDGIADKLVTEITENPFFHGTHSYTKSMVDELLEKVKQDEEAYIYATFDLGTLLAFKNLKDKTDTSETIKGQIGEVETWVNSIMAYAFQKKDEIRAADDPSLITWDFTQFDAAKPSLTLESLY